MAGSWPYPRMLERLIRDKHFTLLSSDKEKQVSKIDTGSTGRECEARGCVRRRRRREGRAPARELQDEGQGC